MDQINHLVAWHLYVVSPPTNNSILRDSFIVAAIYILFGCVAQFLSIPPDYAVPVWPSAGVALAAAVLLGPRIFPAIFVAELVINLTITYFHDQSLNILTIASAILIGIGATAQAGIISAVLQRYFPDCLKLSTGKDIIVFILFAGPIGCLISSSNGASQLVLFGIIEPSNWFQSWVTWWTGDAVGNLSVTPIILKLFEPNIRGNKLRTFTYLTPSVLLIVLLVVAFSYVRDLEDDNRISVISTKANRVLDELNWHTVQMENLINSLHAYFDSAPHVSFSEFDNFSAHLYSTHPSIQALEWIPYVPHAKRDQLIADAKAAGFKDFEFREQSPTQALVVSPTHDFYLPIYYVYPYQLNARVHGLDVGQLTYRSEVLRNIFISGNKSLSSPLQLVQDDQRQYAYILAMPVYSKKLTLPLPYAEIEPFIKGLVQVIVRVPDIIEEVVKSQETPALFDIQLFDLSPGEKIKRIFSQTDFEFNAYTWSQELDLFGRKLRLTLQPKPAFMSQLKGWQSYSVLIAGLFYVAILEILILSTLGRQRDIESKVLLQTQDLNEAKRIAEQASAAKSDFLSKMTHEFQTPINKIFENTHSLLSEELSSSPRDTLDKLESTLENTIQLQSLIANLFDISLIDTSELILNLTTVELSPLLRQTVKELTPAASHKGLEITLKIADDFILKADEKRIKQILEHLIHNAIKYTEKGFIIVIASYEKRDSQPGVLIRVIDSGLGIADEELANLFETFTQAQRRHAVPNHGAGLGLAITKNLVALHGGVVTVSSQSKVGSEFSVWLPIIEHE